MLQENVSGYIKYLKATNDLKSDNKKENISDVDYEKERALLEKAKRKKAEIELELLEGKVHSSKAVEKILNDMLGNFKSKLLSIPSKIAPQIIGLENIGEIQELIRIEVEEALNELSEYDPEKFKSIDINGVKNER